MAFNFDTALYNLDFSEETAAVQAMGGLDEETVMNWQPDDSALEEITAAVVKEFAALPPAVAPAAVFVPAAVVTPPASFDSQGSSAADVSFYLPPDTFTPPISPEALDWSGFEEELQRIQNYEGELADVPPVALPLAPVPPLPAAPAAPALAPPAPAALPLAPPALALSPDKRGRGRPKGSKNKVQKNTASVSLSAEASKIRRRKTGQPFILEENMVLETVTSMRKAEHQPYRPCEQHGRNDFKKAAMAKNKLAEEQNRRRNDLQVFG